MPAGVLVWLVLSITWLAFCFLLGPSINDVYQRGELIDVCGPVLVLAGLVWALKG